MTDSVLSRFRVILAGSVQSSRRILQGLLRNRANVIGVLGLSPEISKNSMVDTLPRMVSSLGHCPRNRFMP
jgi:hypothetical protein